MKSNFSHLFGHTLQLEGPLMDTDWKGMDRGRYLFFLKMYEDFDYLFLAKATLSADDIEYLKKNTRYDEQEIKEWYRCAEFLDY